MIILPQRAALCKGGSRKKCTKLPFGRSSEFRAEAPLCGTARVGQAVTVAEHIGDDAGEHIEVVAVGERGAVGAQPFERAVLLSSVVLTQPVEEAAAAAHRLVQQAAVQSVGAEDIVFLLLPSSVQPS